MVLLPMSVLGQFPNNLCHVEGQVCETTEDNLIEIISDVETLEECGNLCYTDRNCHVFNYFGANSFPFTRTCVKLLTCDTLLPCEDCYAEDEYCPCGSMVEGQIGNNLIEYISLVPSESDCKFMCFDREGCSFFTYYDENHIGFPKTCFLLNAIEYPIRMCENCTTSPVNCNVGHCGFYDTQDASTMVVSKSTEVNILGLGRCRPLKALAMGPGGCYNIFYNGSSTFRNGGGSGYLNFTLIPINGLFELTINVGIGSGDASSIVGEDGTVLLEAASGEKGQRDKAGDGYSGGGGAGRYCTGSKYPGGDGGCNGGSGQEAEFGDPGIGSGFQVDSLPFQVLSIR